MPVLAEHFLSINGEGPHAGELAVFLRFAGCNLDCSYCDTAWANSPDCATEQVEVDELLACIAETGAHRVTVTGGEPLIHEEALSLIGELLERTGACVEVETNGSVDLGQLCTLRDELAEPHRLALTVDMKTPGSGMQNSFFSENLSKLECWDSVKFVICDQDDLAFAADAVEGRSLTSRCNVFFSPAFGRIEPADIVDYMKERKLSGVCLQLQLHKHIWDPEARGV